MADQLPVCYFGIMNINPTFIAKLKHIEEMIRQHNDRAARRYFNQDILRAFHPAQLDNNVTMLVYDLDRYFNDAGLRSLNAPVTKLEYILDSLEELRQKEEK